MPWTSQHLDWLADTGETLTTADGKAVKIYKLSPQNHDEIFTSWAKHFRNHYCLDSEIDALRAGTGLSRADYLLEYAFPGKSAPPGPSIRAGDFAEILLADYLEFLCQFWVPRFRYDEKAIRDESTKGADVIGFKFIFSDETADDILSTFEAKAKLTGTATGNRLQDAVDDSEKDFYVRKGQSLNAIKRRLIRSGNREDAEKVARFQNKADHPYREISGAAAVLSTSAFDPTALGATNTSSHPNNGDLELLIITGESLMDLVHFLYDKAADDA
jgi:hypothetical protein